MENENVEIEKSPDDLVNAYNILFTPEALNFLSEIVTEFDQRIDQLYVNRIQKKIIYKQNLQLPKFATTSQCRLNKEWKISPLPDRLLCRHIDVGDVSPANLQHLLTSLKSNANGVQVDFDDGHCPTWRNQILGLYNVYLVVHGLIEQLPTLNELPVLMLRPRAWNMIENNIMINGKKIPGSLFDFTLLMFHNGKKLTETNCGPFFYLSKLEGAGEAKLWNDIFVSVQNRLNIPRGSIKACVLIENILSSFEMDEILYELREHSLGLNCGIWDYAASIINKFGDNRNFLLPDRNKYVNMDKIFLKKYMQLVVQTCHARNAPATGGMAAQLLLEENKSDIVKKINEAKTKEIQRGCDGFLIYDINVIPHLKQLWEQFPNAFPNQINSNTPTTATIITENDLLQIPTGSVTLSGLKHNIRIVILFIYNWFCGKGHFMYKGNVEDSATAEISRSQIWQWIRHKANLEDNENTTTTLTTSTAATIIIITKKLVQYLANEFLYEVEDVEEEKECVTYNREVLTIAKELFLDIVTARDFIDFITTYLNENTQFRTHHQQCSIK